MSFRDFIDQLKENGKLVEIPQSVSPVFEASRIAKRIKSNIVVFFIS